MKQLGVFLLPPEWDVSQLQGYPQQYFFTWSLSVFDHVAFSKSKINKIESATTTLKWPCILQYYWSKCLAQEHDRKSLYRAWTWTAQSADMCINHEVTMLYTRSEVSFNPFQYLVPEEANSFKTGFIHKVTSEKSYPPITWKLQELHCNLTLKHFCSLFETL